MVLCEYAVCIDIFRDWLCSPTQKGSASETLLTLSDEQKQIDRRMLRRELSSRQQIQCCLAWMIAVADARPVAESQLQNILELQG